jgi:hypothetical protein
VQAYLLRGVGLDGKTWGSLTLLHSVAQELGEFGAGVDAVCEGIKRVGVGERSAGVALRQVVIHLEDGQLEVYAFRDQEGETLVDRGDILAGHRLHHHIFLLCLQQGHLYRLAEQSEWRV